VALDHHVEGTRRRRLGSGLDRLHRQVVALGRGAQAAQHAGRQVQRGDAVAQPGTRQRQEAGPGADVEHLGRRGRQQPDQGGVPGRPLGRRGGAVVR
jgi:hypothetical protein